MNHDQDPWQAGAWLECGTGAETAQSPARPVSGNRGFTGMWRNRWLVGIHNPEIAGNERKHPVTGKGSR
jgi:hypothetical protein